MYGYRFSFLHEGERKRILVIGRTQQKLWNQAFAEVRAVGADENTLRVEFRIIRAPDGKIIRLR